MHYKDLREFIALVEKVNLLRHVHGAQTHLEIGGVTEVAAGLPDCPALLFDDIPGFPRGFRIFTNPVNTPQRAALALGIDPKLRPIDALKAWMEKRKKLTARAPVMVKHGAFLENTDEDDAVDLGKFPVPVWHQKDGGPYIGSGSIVVMRDPDSSWINASIYRVQVHGKNRVTVQFDHPGRHGAIIAKKYWDRGQPCPVAVVNGEDPALFIAGFESLPSGFSEFDFAGAIKEEPVELCPVPRTGLPIPIHAEIVLEGVFHPPPAKALMEGPIRRVHRLLRLRAAPAADDGSPGHTLPQRSRSCSGRRRSSRRATTAGCRFAPVASGRISTTAGSPISAGSGSMSPRS